MTLSRPYMWYAKKDLDNPFMSPSCAKNIAWKQVNEPFKNGMDDIWLNILLSNAFFITLVCCENLQNYELKVHFQIYILISWWEEKLINTLERRWVENVLTYW